MKKIRTLPILLSLILLLGLLTGCGAQSAANEAAPELRPMDVETAETSGALAGPDALDALPQSDRKLVKTVSIHAETESFDSLMKELDARIAALSGYVETRDTYFGSSRYDSDSRNVSMTVRIPADRLEEFVDQVHANANVLDLSESTEDITLQYTDTASRIAALETEQARLMELLASAENLDAVLQIEERLSEVNFELDRYGSQKRLYDNQVDYATVHLTIWEVGQLTPMEEPSVWQRIRDGLQGSLKSLSSDITDGFVWFVVELPYLLVWGAIAAAAFFLIRRFRRRRKAAKSRRKPEDPA